MKHLASFIIPTIIIMAMRKRITSREANLIKFSRFTARMRISTQLPINTKLNLKSQKKSVPKIEREKMAITKDCIRERPIRYPTIPRHNEIKNKKMHFFAIDCYLFELAISKN